MENPPAPAENSCAGGFSYLISNVATVIKRDRDLAILVDRQRFHTIDMRVRNDHIIGFGDAVGKQLALVFASLRIGNAAVLRKIVKKL